METTGIIVAVVLFAVGITLGFLVGKRRTHPQAQSEYDTDSNKNAEYVKALADKDNIIRQSQEDLEAIKQKAEDLKSQNSALRSEKDKQIRKLEMQLQSVTEGKVDDVVKSKLENIVKLQKQVKDLEDNVDDLEDAVDSYKKKLRNKDSELAKSQDELDNITREAKGIKEELSHTKEVLAEKSAVLDMKVQGLEFVQEILLAKSADSDDDKRLGRKVEELTDFIRGDFKEAYESIPSDDPNQNGVNEAMFGNGLDDWAATAKKSWLYGKTTIAFVGEFSAGKTSIVNRILSQDDPKVPLLPVSTKATTAIPTYISGAEAPSYRFVTPADEIKALSEATFKKVNKDVLDQVKGISSLIKYFVMRYKNPNLANLSILDTPGFNSNDKEDAERTIEVINECDSLFWVFDVNAGTVNRSSIELIRNNLHRPLYVVINKVDTKSKVGVDQVEKLIRKTLSDEGIAVVDFIRFSATAPLNDIMSPILSIHHDSEKDHYQENVLENANQVLKRQQSTAKRAHSKAVKLQNKSDGLVDSFIQSLQSLQEDCNFAHDMPHWETHLFSKNKFEMTADEFEAFEQALLNIRDEHPQNLAGLYDQQKNTVAELVEAWKDDVEEKTKYQSLQRSIKTLTKLINNIKPISPQYANAHAPKAQERNNTQERAISKVYKDSPRQKGQRQQEKEENLEQTLARLGR